METDSKDEDSQDQDMALRSERGTGTTIVEHQKANASIYKKRKRSHRVKDEVKSRVKRAKAAYSAAYLEEYNQAVLDANSEGPNNVWLIPKSSQIALSYWSSEEKESFFRALARHGRSNMLAVVQAIGTKSELQVLEYLRLLDDAALEVETTSRTNVLIGPINIPTAAEISQETSDCLDACAESLSFLVKQDEEIAEKLIYGPEWLLTTNVAKISGTERLNDIPQLGAVKPPERLALALGLFDVPQLLELSQCVFMNSANPSEAWPALSLPDQGPAMFASALLDLQTLVIAKTKSLIAATLFNAMSRLRALDANAANRGTAPAKPFVRSSDVHLAIESVGLPRDSTTFWRGAARRLQLRVGDDSKWLPHIQTESQSYGKEMPEEDLAILSFEEVERLLSPFPTGTSLQDDVDSKDIPLRSAGHDGTSTRSSSPMSSVVTTLNSDDESLDLHVEAEDAETAYLEASDQDLSRQEEARLLAMLPESLTSHINIEQKMPPDPKDNDKRHAVNRKLPRDLAIEDWRRHATKMYQPEWQRYGYLLPETTFGATAGGLNSFDNLPALTRADFRGQSSRRTSPSASMGHETIAATDNEIDDDHSMDSGSSRGRSRGRMGHSQGGRSASWARSSSRGSSRSIIVDRGIVRSVEDESSGRSDVSESAPPSPALTIRRRSSRSASVGRRDYSHSGFGVDGLSRLKRLDDLEDAARDNTEDDDRSISDDERTGARPSIEDA